MKFGGAGYFLATIKRVEGVKFCSSNQIQTLVPWNRFLLYNHK